MFQVIRGEVIHGKKLGRTIGFPTANIHLKSDSGMCSGTYKLNGRIGDKVYRGVGTYREEMELFEAHFFDFSDTIYGSVIEIILGSKLRDNMKFNSLEEVKNQIEKDVLQAKAQNDVVLTFGTFDVFHKGHAHYLKQAKMYGDILVTIVATDSNRKKITGELPDNSINFRVEKLKESAIPDIVEKGNQDDPLIWLDIHQPKVICIGYDQNSFVKALEEKMKKTGSEIIVRRIDSLKPEIYKSSILKTEKGK